MLSRLWVQATLQDNLPLCGCWVFMALSSLLEALWIFIRKREMNKEGERGNSGLPIVNFSLGVTAITSVHSLLARSGNRVVPKCKSAEMRGSV